ncbi:hypothetical protein [Bacillus piscicola]|uniref:hypothetical protein n=1 Tax=Bacillus piscicola TaxID=1632684 RepID=UPI001F097911|nr:hypothetical protein [Bacillus piscicola]
MRFLRMLWLILSLAPAAFLFHFYEYGQYLKQEEASFLLLSSLLYVFIVGLLAGQIKLRYIILLHTITALLSVVLAITFIPDDGGWFAPVGRNVAVMLTAIPFFIGQLIMRTFSKRYFSKRRVMGRTS